VMASGEIGPSYRARAGIPSRVARRIIHAIPARNSRFAGIASVATRPRGDGVSQLAENSNRATRPALARDSGPHLAVAERFRDSSNSLGMTSPSRATGACSRKAGGLPAPRGDARAQSGQTAALVRRRSPAARRCRRRCAGCDTRRSVCLVRGPFGILSTQPTTLPVQMTLKGSCLPTLCARAAT